MLHLICLKLIVWIIDLHYQHVLLVHQPFKLDCRLSDPAVPVLLFSGRQHDHSPAEVKPENYLISQNGQMFTVNVSSLTVGNVLKFECRAINTMDQVIEQKEVILSKARGLKKCCLSFFSYFCLIFVKLSLLWQNNSGVPLESWHTASIDHADNNSRPLPNQYSILLKKNN